MFLEGRKRRPGKSAGLTEKPRTNIKTQIRIRITPRKANTGTHSVVCVFRPKIPTSPIEHAIAAASTPKCGKFVEMGRNVAGISLVISMLRCNNQQKGATLGRALNSAPWNAEI